LKDLTFNALIIILCNYKEEEFVITLQMVAQIVISAGKVALIIRPFFIIVMSVSLIFVVLVLLKKGKLYQKVYKLWFINVNKKQWEHRGIIDATPLTIVSNLWIMYAVLVVLRQVDQVNLFRDIVAPDVILIHVFHVL